MTVQLNGELYDLSQSEPFSVSMPTENLTVSFPVAVDGGFYLDVKVTSSSGNCGYNFPSVLVENSFAQPSDYLNVYGMPYSILIEADNMGWIKTINGTTGQIAYSNKGIAQVLYNSMINGSTIYIRAGTYGFTSSFNATGFSNFNLLGEPGTIFQRPANTNYTVYYNFYSFFPMILIENCSNFKIQGIIFDGNAGNNKIQDPVPTGDGGNMNLKLERCSGGILDNIQSINAWGDPLQIANSKDLSLTNSNFTNNAYVKTQYCLAIGGSKNITVDDIYINGYGKALELFPPFTNKAADNLYHNQYLSFNRLTYIQNWTASLQKYGYGSNTNQSVFIWEANHVTFTDCNFLTAMTNIGNGVLFYPWNIVPPLFYSSNDVIFKGCIIDAGSYTQGMALVDTTGVQLLNCTFLRGKFGAWLNGANNTQIVDCVFKGILTPTAQQLYIGTDAAGNKCLNTIIDNCTFENVSVIPAQLLVMSNSADNITITPTNVFFGNPTVIIGHGNTGVNYG